MAGRAGAPSGAPVPLVRCINPVRSVSSFDTGDGGKSTPKESAMLKLYQALFGGINIVPRFSFSSAFLHRRFSHVGGHNDI